MGPIMAFSNSDIFKKAGIPENYVPLCGVSVGYSGGVGFAQEREKKNNVNYCK